MRRYNLGSLRSGKDTGLSLCERQRRAPPGSRRHGGLSALPPPLPSTPRLPRPSERTLPREIKGKGAAKVSALPGRPRQLDVLCVKVWLGKRWPLVSKAGRGGSAWRVSEAGRAAGDLQAEWRGRSSPDSPPPWADCIRVPPPHQHSARQPHTYIHTPGAEGLQPDSLATTGRVALFAFAVWGKRGLSDHHPSLPVRPPS